MIIPRRIKTHINEIGQFFPIISLTGPRQAGKTTLLSRLFPNYEYISFEALDIREAALKDMRGFLEQHSYNVIFDEAQLVPPLFNYLQEVVDEDRQPSRFILSGSQNFLLHKGITQSLAGRAAITKLFPLDLLELAAVNKLPKSPEEAIFNGFYPNHFSIGTPPRFFYPSYISSYLERDVTDLINPSNLKSFLLFMESCAHFSGQLMNYERLSQMAGISRKTLDSWLSILEMSFIIFRISPHFENFGKRITKSPKLYFYDTGLLCYLLKLRSPEEVRQDLKYGALFENLIVAERKKALQHIGERADLSFFRDSNGLEADIFEGGNANRLISEIKSSKTYSRHWDKNIRKIGNLNKKVEAKYRVIHGGDNRFEVGETSYIPWFEAGIK